MNKPCATCPFLEVNKGKPTPTDFKCLEENENDWYTDENLDGVSKVSRSFAPAFLSCHSTDPDYYGQDNKPVYACVGLALMVYMHLKVFELAAGDYETYRVAVGIENAMPFAVLAQKTMAFAAKNTGPLFGNMKLPEQFRINFEDLRFPPSFEKYRQLLYSSMLTSKIL